MIGITSVPKYKPLLESKVLYLGTEVVTFFMPYLRFVMANRSYWTEDFWSGGL